MIPPAVVKQFLWENYHGLPDEVHSFSRWLPFYMEGYQHLLKKFERERVFNYIVPGIINKCELRHFGMRQTHRTGMRITVRPEDAIHYHKERILLFFEWIECFPFLEVKNGKVQKVWEDTERYTARVVYQFDKAFHKLEGILQWRRLGVSMPTHNTKGDEMNLMKLTSHWVVDYLIHYQCWKRDHATVPLDVYYMRRFNKVPSERSFRTFKMRMNYVENLIVSSGGLNDYRIVGLSGTNADYEDREEMDLL